MQSSDPLYCALWDSALCVKAEVWAAWAQAVGSVLAIVLSVWAVDRAHKLTGKADREREARAAVGEIEPFEEFLDDVLSLLRRIGHDAADLDRLREVWERPSTQAEFSSIMQSLDGVRERATTRPDVAVAVIAGINAIRNARAALGYAFAPVQEDRLPIDEVRRRVDGAAETLWAIVKRLREARHRRLDRTY